MPGTHLLPPNLLKLFAPRPPLPYKRPIGRDINRVRPKNITGVAAILNQLKEATTDNIISAGAAESMEEGEEPAFTYAEETKRQLKREDRKKKKTEEFKIAKEKCTFCLPMLTIRSLIVLLQTNLLTTQRRLGIHTRRCSFPDWYDCPRSSYLPLTFCSIKAPRKQTFAENLKAMAPLSASE